MPPRAILSSVCLTTCSAWSRRSARVLPEQHLQVHRVGKLGCLAEPAVERVEAPHDHLGGLIEMAEAERFFARGA